MSGATGLPRSHLFAATFYSYKGGVGRSVALLNTANQLASRGRSVVMIDFDLEAPGLHSSVRKAWPKAKLKRKGILDYFADYRRKSKRARVATPPALDAYLSPGFGPGNRIRLITAGDIGNDYAGYARRLAELSIVDFAAKWYGRELLLHLREELGRAGFDYLLIDSRTGHTDALGATTILLPHVVVLLSNLAEQSIDGTRLTLEFIRQNGVWGAGSDGKPYRSSNLLAARDPSDPDIETLVVASPVPFGEQEGVMRLRKALGSVDHVLYHVPRIAADECRHVITDASHLALRHDPRLDPAFQMFSQLADRIEALNPYESRSLTALGFDALARQDWRVALAYLAAAESFLPGSPDDRTSAPDRELQVRIALGKARALAIGFQTEASGALIEQAEVEAIRLATERHPTEALKQELIVAYMQRVRGLYGANRLREAIMPAKAAASVAATLDDRSARDHWSLTTGLVGAEAMMLGGDYDGAVQSATPLPGQARRLNRAAEMLTARQIRIVAYLNNGQVRDAEESGAPTVEEAEAFGVDYLIAETHYVMAIVEMAAGKTTDDGVARLRNAEDIYERVGDGFGLSNCRCEMGLYLHRRGFSTDEIRRVLAAAVEGYQKISGSALGEITSLVYATRMLIDRGQLDGPASDRPPLSASLIASSLPRAADTLCLAAGIARDNVITLLDDLISAYREELALFTDPSWVQYVEREIYSEHPPVLGEAEPNPANQLEARRSRLLARLVRGAPEDAGDAADLLSLADEAIRLGARHEAACTIALVALALHAAGDRPARDKQLAQLADLHAEHPLAWPIWGQVCAVRDHLRLSNAGAWKSSAASLLVHVADDPSLPPVPRAS